MRGYDQIKVVSDLDPVAAMRDRDLGTRMRDYPRFISGGGPDFGFAIQTAAQDGAAWRVGTAGGGDPYTSRIALASHLRVEAEERQDDVLDALDQEEGAAERQEEVADKDPPPRHREEQRLQALQAATVDLTAAVRAVEGVAVEPIEGDQRVAAEELADRA